MGLEVERVGLLWCPSMVAMMSDARKDSSYLSGGGHLTGGLLAPSGSEETSARQEQLAMARGRSTVRLPGGLEG